LLQFAGFRERLLADDLFLFKVFMECGVGLFTKVSLYLSLCIIQIPMPRLFFYLFSINFGFCFILQTAAEYQKRKENFFNELEVVFADVVWIPYVNRIPLQHW
jgi:hypothetical protein